jgi:hypothetical protein
MLYDPKWEKQAETKADPFALATLIAWLESQPADVSYRYTCNGHCLLAQYFTAQGYNDVRMGDRDFDHRDAPNVAIPAVFNDIAIDRGSYPKDRTFGGALRRARSSLT